MRKYDDDYYVLRYQPRKPRSTWSARNRELAERLMAEGRMRPAGLTRCRRPRRTGAGTPPEARNSAEGVLERILAACGGQMGSQGMDS